ncbi:MAG: phosphoadenosine phosphosulfate reductase family protein [Candidatus Hodgkinia cicadicola]
MHSCGPLCSECRILRLVSRWLNTSSSITCWSRKLRIGLLTSFSVEDQMLLKLIEEASCRPSAWAVNTNKLFTEVLQLITSWCLSVGWRLTVKFPHLAWAACEAVSRGDVYSSFAARLDCCKLRKLLCVSGLSCFDVWIAGVRCAHSEARQTFETVQWDRRSRGAKLCPIALWSCEDVLDGAFSMAVTYNVLHDVGYKSVGCLPCTRAVRSNEAARAGRWWWERAELAVDECGLHVA